MRILLFDWTSGGHHAIYVQRFAAALSKRAAITAAVPDETAALLSASDTDLFPLGSARPLPDYEKPLAPQNREHALHELDHFDRAVSAVKPGHVIHLYADPVIRRIVQKPPYSVPVTLCLFWPRAHYPSLYGTRLDLSELLRAWFLEYLSFRWRMRSDAHSIFVLDENVPPRWNRLGGAKVFWLPEPPVESTAGNDANRSGCILYGALARRKGIDLLARAVALDPISIRVVLAGSVEPGFERDLQQYCESMIAAGADLEVRDRTHSEQEGINALTGAGCAVLPYPRHYGMSRILLEACHAGTPVITTKDGLLGHLVSRYGLGSAVDCNDAGALRAAIMHMCDDSKRGRYAPSLKSFAGRYSNRCFESSVTAPYFQTSGGTT